MDKPVSTPPVRFSELKGEKLVRQVPRTGGIVDVVLPAGVILMVIFAGVGTGWWLASSPKTGTMGEPKGVAVQATKEGLGICKDDQTFRDGAEGELAEGGIDGEGAFHLVRDGGPSQNVYLTSTSVDLSQFVGKKVKVMGETMAARKAGWLMDVGCVKPM